MSADPVSLLFGGLLALATVGAVIATVVICLPLILGLVYVLGAASVQVIARAVRYVQGALATRPSE